MPKSKYPWLGWLIKVALLLLLIWAIYHYLWVKNDFNSVVEQFTASFSTGGIWFLIAVCLLMFVNWNIEALKWRWLIAKTEKINQLNAFMAICAGITLSMFTPNRIGEFGGRILFLKKVNKTAGVSISLLGSLSQWIASVGIGIVGVLLFLIRFTNIDISIVLAFAALAISTLIIVFYLFYKSTELPAFTVSFKWIEKVNKLISALKKLDKSDLIKAIGLSGLRHGVFSFQYILLFYFFGLDFPFYEGVILVLSIFLVQTLVPSIALVELGIRTSIAIFFMNYINANPISVISAALSLWVINLMMPSLVGLIAIFKLNLTKELFDEDNG